MSNRDKVSNIEALASYLLDVIDAGEADEHYLPIFNAQCNGKDADYIKVVKALYRWADEEVA